MTYPEPSPPDRHAPLLLVIFLWFAGCVAVFGGSGCVRRGQVCLEVSHGRVDPNWSRSDNVGASACADIEPPGEE
jgi:hypothetical protein